MKYLPEPGSPVQAKNGRSVFRNQALERIRIRAVFRQIADEQTGQVSRFFRIRNFSILTIDFPEPAMNDPLNPFGITFPETPD